MKFILKISNIKGDACVVQLANTTTVSPIGSVILNGSEHIISPLAVFIQQNPDIKVKNTGQKSNSLKIILKIFILRLFTLENQL